MTDVIDSENSEAQEDSGDEKAKGGFRELLSTVLWALGIAFVLRTFIFQPFHIPSGSMAPGLMKGDYIITSKYSVGYGKHAATPFPFPVKKGRLFERELKRGDVIVFRVENPSKGDKNFIKRVVGLPGDQVQIKEGRLFLNGEQVPVQDAGTYPYDDNGRIQDTELLIETFPDGRTHEVLDAEQNSYLDRLGGNYTVPTGYYFMMGDNRDHSFDSRVSVDKGGAGIVPEENIIGRAEIILLSVDDDFVLFKPWTWLNMRKDRWFKDVK